MPMKTCKRGHAFTKANTYRQTNSYTRKDGSVKVYTTPVCRACSTSRLARRAAGLPVKDMRKGRRARKAA